MTETQQEALRALNRMALIVKREQLIHGHYVSTAVESEKSRQLCGGRKYCAIGALWVGAGIKPVVEVDAFGNTSVELPGADYNRDIFVAANPVLDLALGALNRAANEYIDAKGIDRDSLAHIDRDTIENLFEGETEDGWLVEPSDVLSIIAEARKIIRKGTA